MHITEHCKSYLIHCISDSANGYRIERLIRPTKGCFHFKDKLEKDTQAFLKNLILSLKCTIGKDRKYRRLLRSKS